MNRCFAGCNSLQSVVFAQPSHLEEIESYAFLNCDSLTAIQLPSTIVAIRECAFVRCGHLITCDIGNNSALQRIHASAFSETVLRQFVFPATIEYIGGNAFPSGCRFQYSTQAQQLVLAHWLSRFLVDPHSKFTPELIHPIRDIADYLMNREDYHELPDSCDFLNTGEDVHDVHVVEKAETTERFVIITCCKFQKANRRAIMEPLAMQQAVTMAEIHHPCVVPLAGYCPPHDNTGPTIAIPFVGPDSLESILDSEEVPDWWTSTAKTVVIIGIIVGMHLIHSAGYRHQNLQPSNILLNGETHVPMILGIGPKEGQPLGRPLKWTHENVMYKAPEVHRTGVVTQKADVFSFGMILYEIVTGERLSNETAPAGGVRPPFRAPVNPFAKGLIQGCWDGNASARPTFKEIFADLKSSHFGVFQDIDHDQIDGFIDHLTSPENW
jgi:serine/threonine protein kinase